MLIFEKEVGICEGFIDSNNWKHGCLRQELCSFDYKFI